MLRLEEHGSTPTKELPEDEVELLVLGVEPVLLVLVGLLVSLGLHRLLGAVPIVVGSFLCVDEGGVSIRNLLEDFLRA